MDLSIFNRQGTIPLFMEIGDNPGQTIRRLITHGANPSPSLRSILDDLQAVGLVEGLDDTFRGKSVTRMHLTPRGEDIYRLLCVIRGMS